MTHLDGNMLAGTLADVLGIDPTDRAARCAHCGATALFAAAIVYATAMGTVARCATCAGVLAVMVRADDGRAWFGMPGVTALEIS